jgi:hypothetical protein
MHWLLLPPRRLNPQPVGSGSTGGMGAEARQHLQAALARLVAEAAEGGCEWLQAYCDFLQRRHWVA